MAGSCGLPFLLSYLRTFNNVGRNENICNQGYSDYFQKQLRGQNRIVIYFPRTLVTLIALIPLKTNCVLDDTQQEGRGTECQPYQIPKIGYSESPDSVCLVHHSMFIPLHKFSTQQGLNKYLWGA